MRIARTSVVLVLLASLLTSCGSPAADPPAPPSVTELRTAETEIFDLLNDSRVASGLSEVVRDPGLDSVARAWAVRLAATGELQHNPSYAAEIPDGWTASGENVGWVDRATETLDRLPAALHQAWLDSASHRANIEDPAYTAVGVGIAYDADRGYYVTENFAAYPD